MNNFIYRSKIFVLIALLVVPSIAKPVIPDMKSMKSMIIPVALFCCCEVAALVYKECTKKNSNPALSHYSDAEKAVVRNVLTSCDIAPDVIEGILSCICRTDESLKKLYGGLFSMGNSIVIYPDFFKDSKPVLRGLLAKLREKSVTFSTVDHPFTDYEHAYVILHEYGHVMHGHGFVKNSVGLNILQKFALQMSVIYLLKRIMPNIKYRELIIFMPVYIFFWMCSKIPVRIRMQEHAADDYAFNALKKNAPAGCLVLEKIIRDKGYVLPVSITGKVALIDRVKFFLASPAHPSPWARYQHACAVAKKYGWAPEVAPIVA